MNRKQKFLALILVIVLTAMSAGAQAASAKALFKYVKNTLTSLAAGDYDKIVENLPVSGIEPDSDEWKKLAERGFSSLAGSSPQTRYAVAYSCGSVWRVAVPVSEPSSDSVEVLYLDSADGKSFCGYGKSTWGDIVSEYRNSDKVIWNEEYLGGTASAEIDSTLPK